MIDRSSQIVFSHLAHYHGILLRDEDLYHTGLFQPWILLSYRTCQGGQIAFTIKYHLLSYEYKLASYCLPRMPLATEAFTWLLEEISSFANFLNNAMYSRVLYRYTLALMAQFHTRSHMVYPPPTLPVFHEILEDINLDRSPMS